MNFYEEQLTNEELNKVLGGLDPEEDNSTNLDYDDAEEEIL
ncbi:hypothetical protein [Marinifilum flexuosum]|uniref:Bacteriocin-like protein n=1 Tax=Marinifilum flexuosum TaxID=1117708 RepID=A0A419XB01_9BACT|nr:hypothetical protein [Marinifilum flexuosum]RKE04924.1 bacteriocin-like protein [Marinifilum flexuosum]